MILLQFYSYYQKSNETSFHNFKIQKKKHTKNHQLKCTHLHAIHPADASNLYKIQNKFIFKGQDFPVKIYEQKLENISYKVYKKVS